MYEALLVSLAEDLVGNDDFFEEMEAEDDAPSGGGGLLGRLFGRKKAEAPPAPTGPYPTSEQLLHALIFGEPLDPRCGAKLAYVFEMVVRKHGRSLDAGSFSSMRSGSNWTGEFDQILAKGGVPRETFSIEGHLMERYGPPPFPTPDDFPAYGYLTAAEAPAAQEALASPKLDELAGLHKWPEEAKAGLKVARSWVKEAVAKDADLFAFYY